MVWKNLKKWLASGLLAGSLLMPNIGKGAQDYLLIDQHVNNQIEDRFESLAVAHRSTAIEGYSSGSDIDYVFPSLWSGEWAPKIITKIEGYELESDKRPTNSVSSFEAVLNFLVQNSQSISGSTKLGIVCSSNATYTGFDSKRHYPAEYQIYTNFTADGKGFIERKNLRDLCTNVNVSYEWGGPTNFIVNTTTNGEFNTGKYTQFCDWNQLVSSSTSGGTNNPQGTQILDYNTNKTVSLTANSGNYIDYYVLTRTDNTGLVSVVTNDFAGTDVISTNVPINGIKGSNSIYAVYATAPPSTFNVGIENGAKYGLNPTNFTGVSSGSSITSTASSIYYTNSVGIRNKIIGLGKK